MPELETVRPLKVNPIGASEIRISNRGLNGAFYDRTPEVSASKKVGTIASGEVLSLQSNSPPVYLLAEATPVIVDLREVETVGGISTPGNLQTSVLTYGADPSGVADSTEAFKKAGEASNNIYAPAGTYLIEGELELKNKRLVGDGPQATTLKKTTAATPMLTITEGAGEITGLRLEFTFFPPTSGAAIKLNHTKEPCTLRDLFIRNPFIGVEVTGASDVNMSEVTVRGWKNAGFYIHDGPVLVQMINCLAANVNFPETEVTFTGVAYWLEKNVEGVALVNCESIGGELGLFITAVGIEAEAANANVFSNCFFDTSAPVAGKGGMHLINAGNTRFSNCWTAPSGGAVTTGNGIFIEGCNGLTFTNQTVTSAAEHGILVKNSESLTFVGCDFFDNSHKEIGVFDAIHIEEKCARLAIIGNRFGQAPKAAHEERFGVFIGPTTNTDYTIIGNRGNLLTNAVVNDNATTKLKYVAHNFEAGKAPTGASGTLKEAGAAAVKPTANTVIGNTIFNLTGSKAKGFVNNAIVSFKALTAGVTNPKTGISYFVIGEATNSFELATSVGGKAASILTGNTAIAGTVFNLTGAKAKGFTNGSPVLVRTVTPEVTNPKAGTTYFVLGEATNTFELAATPGGAAIKVEGHELLGASTEVNLEATAVKVEGHELETATTEITLEGAASDKSVHTRVTLVGEVEAEKTPEIKVTVEGNEAGKVKPFKSGAAEVQLLNLGTYDLLPGGKWQVKEAAGLAKVFASTATLNA